MSSTSLNKFLNKITESGVKINPRHDFDFDKTRFIQFYPDKTDISINFDIGNFTSYFIQSFNIPDFDVTDDNTIETMISKSASHTLILTPSSNTFTMSIINTNNFFIEKVFYPWLNELKSSEWCYDVFPYTTATFVLKMADSSISYIFFGCRPIEIELYKPTQELVTTLTRDVVFTFDFMKIVDGDINNEIAVVENQSDMMEIFNSDSINSIDNIRTEQQDSIEEQSDQTAYSSDSDNSINTENEPRPWIPTAGVMYQQTADKSVDRISNYGIPLSPALQEAKDAIIQETNPANIYGPTSSTSQQILDAPQPTQAIKNEIEANSNTQSSKNDKILSPETQSTPTSTEVKDDKYTHIVHVVQNGQDVFDIAVKYDVSRESIRNANNLKTDIVDPGKVLTIPVKVKDDKYTHTVQYGQDIIDIAVKYGVPIDNIKKANNLEADTLNPGQQLIIPVEVRTK